MTPSPLDTLRQAMEAIEAAIAVMPRDTAIPEGFFIRYLPCNEKMALQLALDKLPQAIAAVEKMGSALLEIAQLGDGSPKHAHQWSKIGRAAVTIARAWFGKDYGEAAKQAAVEKTMQPKPKMQPCECDDGTDWSSGKAVVCDLCGGSGELPILTLPEKMMHPMAEDVYPDITMAVRGDRGEYESVTEWQKAEGKMVQPVSLEKCLKAVNEIELPLETLSDEEFFGVIARAVLDSAKAQGAAIDYE